MLSGTRGDGTFVIQMSFKELNDLLLPAGLHSDGTLQAGLALSAAAWAVAGQPGSSPFQAGKSTQFNITGQTFEFVYFP